MSSLHFAGGHWVPGHWVDGHWVDDDVDVWAEVVESPVVAGVDGGNRIGPPLALAVFQREHNIIQLSRAEMDGTWFDFAGINGQFIVHNENNPTRFLWGVGPESINVADDSTIIQIPIDKSHTGSAGRNQRWILWDDDATVALLHGRIWVEPARENHGG